MTKTGTLSAKARLRHKVNAIFRHLQDVFTIDNPFLLIALLLIIIFSRFNVSYFNNTHTVMAPDINFYAREVVGHDLFFATTNQAYRLFKGLPMQMDVGYGYTFTLLTAWIITLFNWLHLCSSADHISCQFLFYKIEVVLALGWLLLLPFLLIKDRNRQVTALLFLIAFLLGVPGGMGIESGNLDILLSVLYGFMLYMQRISHKNKRSYLYPIILGFLAGALLQTKLFILPIAIIFLLYSTKRVVFVLSLLATASLITILPAFYHVPINPLYTIQAAQTLRSVTHLSSEIVYGNNDTRAMIGGVVLAIPSLRANQFVRNLLINIGGGLVFLLVIVLPLSSVFSKLTNRIKRISFRDLLDYKLFIVLNCYAVTTMILWPEISLTYRFYYLIPLVYLLIETADSTFAKRSLGIALAALFIRSSFVWHIRILQLFLLVFFYLFIVTSLRVWLGSSNRAVNRARK